MKNFQEYINEVDAPATTPAPLAPVPTQPTIGLWNPIDRQPPKGEDYGAFYHSIDVIITDKKGCWVGYLETNEDNEFAPQWKEKGRDSYTITGITHWMMLPKMPG